MLYIKIFVVEDSLQPEQVSLYLKEKEDIKIIGHGYDEKLIYDTLKEYKVDILCVVLYSENYDGLDIITKIKENSDLNKPKHIIVISDFVSSFIEKRLNQLDVDYFFVKQNSFELLYDNIKMLSVRDYLGTSDINDAELEEEISLMLHEMGIQPHLKGYRYLRYAIAKVYQNINLIGEVTKVLYPKIAERFDTTDTRVERAIRHAIERAFEHVDSATVNDYFSNTIDTSKKKVSNAEFIAMLADRLRIKKNKERNNKTRYIG